MVIYDAEEEGVEEGHENQLAFCDAVDSTLFCKNFSIVWISILKPITPITIINGNKNILRASEIRNKTNGNDDRNSNTGLKVARFI